MKTLDITSFQNAVKSLDAILNRYARENDADIRDAVIQRFEYTYSLALKIMTRFINYSANEIIPVMTFNEIIRKSNQLGILRTNLETWDKYRQFRNMTSHTYDEEVAKQVVSIIPDFKNEAVFLLNKLKEKLI